MKLGARRVVLAACALLVAVIAARAQGKRPMSIVDLLSVPVVADPQLSPDGRQLLYVQTVTDWKANRKTPHLWRVNREGGAPAVQLTFGENGESAPRWSPDGTQIGFLAARPDAPGQQIYLMNRDGGEPRVLSKHAGGLYPIGFTWSPDGSTIYFLATDPRPEEDTQRDRLRAGLAAFEENLRMRHLWKISVADGKEQRVTSGDYSVLDYSISADGKRIAFDRAPTTLLDDTEQSEVWVMDADGKNALQLTRNTIWERYAALSPDGSRVLFTAGASPTFEPYYNDNFFTVPAGGGTATAIIPDFPYEVNGRPLWAPDGKTVFAVANMGVTTQIVQVDPASKTFKALTSGDHQIPFGTAPGAWDVHAKTGVHVFMRDEPTRYGEVWTMPLAGGTPTMVTRVFDYLDRDFKLPRQEKVQWKGADGVTIEGLIFYPTDYEAGRKYPLIVQLHGGPEESDHFSFPGITYYPQVLTGKGYLLLKPNYRGSTGYGNAFLRDVVGALFKNSTLDVIAGVDALVARGLVDPDKIGVMGFSAGASLTNKLITMTDRFKAAASFSGVSNWLALYSQSDIRRRRALWFGGTPYGRDAPVNVYLEQSPLKDAWKVKTPTIFSAGEDDARVPRYQSIEMFRALKANGVPAQLYIAPGEGHNWGQPRHFLAKTNQELGWFEKYLMNRPYEEDRAPGDPAPKPRTQ